ncbi:sulfatase family protein [Spongiivirga citrea]|uniref:Sulfatase-like hydrolase/transferase n=1 Tax=Spongiivirga citrea TaxID=1481457 RepID=A0A6M0CVR7_9FLAO|nr:arylsulfatase [Spongiivirga citrea]NER17860.1 sulfatase-like hydrolase/transferase [Spongiivirga citrea]
MFPVTNLLLSFFVLNAFLVFAQEIKIGKEKPNIVLIYVDDLGYGDIGVNGAIGVKTPNIDKLAIKGINFTDAHATAATCTPSRYSLLTGQYAFRNKAHIINGDAPLIIDTEMRTLPDMLKDAGYTTGVVGKWHLGLGNGKANWNGTVSPGPKEVGFDYSFLIPATGDRVPTVYLENQKVVGLDLNDSIAVSYTTRLDGYPIGTEHPELLKQHTDGQHLGSITNGISRIGYMKGGKSALWIDEEIPFVLTKKANSFVDINKKNPFFLFFSLHDIHQPRIANIKFVEASIMGPRGDVIAQMDWCVGQIIEKLEKLNLVNNTMIIFTSDNGPILDDGYLDYARELVGEHKPGGVYRGSKYSIYEAGTRMPTIISWPKAIRPGTSHALLSQVDLYASLAKLVGQKLKKEDAVDSEEHLKAWLGKKTKGREILLEEAYAFGLRMNDFKYIMPKKSNKIPPWITRKFVDPGFSIEPQLFNLKTDPSESKNIASEHPDMVNKMQRLLNNILEPNESK